MHFWKSAFLELFLRYEIFFWLLGRGRKLAFYITSKSGELAAIPYGLEKISSQAHYNKEEYKYRLFIGVKNTFSA